MLRSLFAGISGLRTNQTMLDVTGNNIANANTVGYKSSGTVFSDTLSQMLTAASGGSPTLGGTNPIQIGLGVQLAATNLNFNQGSAETTGRSTDLMLQGDGFFVLRDGQEDVYSRAGAFSFDQSGNLVAPDGKTVQGYALDATGTATGAPVDINLNMINGSLPAGVGLKAYSIASDGKIRGIFSDGVQRDIGQIAVANFTNPMGLQKIGDTEFRESANSGGVQLGVANQGTNGSIVAGALEMSNVDLSQEFTNLILAQRGFQASARVITTSDSVLEELVNMKR